MTYTELRKSKLRKKNGQFMSYEDYKDKMRRENIISTLFAVGLISLVILTIWLS